jgi:hypothetical protein
MVFPSYKLLKATMAVSFLCFLFTSVNGQEVSESKDLWPVKSSSFLQGFDETVDGTALDFFPFLEPGNVVLYLGENGKYPTFTFRTQEIPMNYPEDMVTFVFQVGYANTSPDLEPSTFKVSINGEDLLTLKSFKDGGYRNWEYTNEAGVQLAFVNTHVDKAYGDLFGYMFLSVPAKDYLGKSLDIRFDEMRSNPRDYFMAIQNPVMESLDILAEPAILKTEEGPKQSIKVDLTYLGKPTKGSFSFNGERLLETEIEVGINNIYLMLDPVKSEITADLQVALEGREIQSQQVTVKPVREFEVYFLPHSHVDIGFTHEQSEVARLQWKNLDMAIDLAEKTADYPERSRYKWNAEISWVLDGYLEQASEDRKAKFIQAVNDGAIGIDGLYGSVLTGLQREEELYNNTLHAQQLREEYGFDIQSAMITDVPGYTWGIVPALAQTGIKYFSIGPNHMPQLANGGYQVGKTFTAWGDIPVYWKSPSGKDKILFWMSTHGYSWFHSWLMGNISNAGGAPILNFLDELDQQAYPYDIVQLRYNIGNDNGPPDPDMPDFFKAWNEKYEWPKFRIATTMEMMEDFVERYDEMIPETTGDFTPYWEDGASSSATETSINRNTADRLVQAETLWAMVQDKPYPVDEFDQAWKNVVLFSEHTWGANISKSDPDSEFTRSLWEVKKGFTMDARETSEKLVKQAIEPLTDQMEIIDQIQVINSLSWSRTELVRIPSEWNLKGTKIQDSDGNAVNAQELSTGEVVFVANEIPAFGSKVYTLKKGNAKTEGKVVISNSKIENDFISVSMDEETGNFKAINSKTRGINFIDPYDTLGFNSYWYSGKIKENPSRDHSPVFEVAENGPLYSSLLVTTQGNGANEITTLIEMSSGFNEVRITNTVDKIRVVDDENVRFSFPFNIDNGQVRMDIPWAVLEPGENQMRGANNNFYSVQRFLDISNDEYGITLTTEDAPIWEVGDMYGQYWMADMVNRPWLKEYQPSQRLIAWVMNNLWFVNYKAYQEGKISFRHTISPHGVFDPAQAKKLGMQRTNPLIVVPSGGQEIDPFVSIDGSESVLVTSFKPGRKDNYKMIRLFNSSSQESTINLSFSKPVKLYESSPLEEKGNAASSGLKLDPWEILTLRIE